MNENNHFGVYSKMVEIGSEAEKEKDWLVEISKPIKTCKVKEENIKDYKLSRYICHFLVQNANSNKSIALLEQTYFAIQTRK